MIFCHPAISEEINISNGYINTLVIENQKLYVTLIEDIFNQINGKNGDAVIGKDLNILPFSKNSELLTSFVPFDLNTKSLLSKINSSVEKEAINPRFYVKTVSLITNIENHLQDVVSGFDCNLAFSKLTIESLIKSAGLEIVDDSQSLSERILTYMELVREFDKDKLFITVNLRSFIDDNDADQFAKTLLLHDFSILMIENKEYPLLSREKRKIIDKDLCEF